MMETVKRYETMCVSGVYGTDLPLHNVETQRDTINVSHRGYSTRDWFNFDGFLYKLFIQIAKGIRAGEIEVVHSDNVLGDIRNRHVPDFLASVETASKLFKLAESLLGDDNLETIKAPSEDSLLGENLKDTIALESQSCVQIQNAVNVFLDSILPALPISSSTNYYTPFLDVGDHSTVAQEAQQKKDRGYADRDIPELRAYVCSIIISGLTQFITHGAGYPGGYETAREWYADISIMQVSLGHLMRNEDVAPITADLDYFNAHPQDWVLELEEEGNPVSDERKAELAERALQRHLEYKEGIDLLREHFLSLWD